MNPNSIQMTSNFKQKASFHFYFRFQKKSFRSLFVEIWVKSPNSISLSIMQIQSIWFLKYKLFSILFFFHSLTNLYCLLSWTEVH